jgi:hypothetical protein
MFTATSISPGRTVGDAGEFVVNKVKIAIELCQSSVGIRQSGVSY